jgi:hypothetical protein
MIFLIKRVIKLIELNSQTVYNLIIWNRWSRRNKAAGGASTGQFGSVWYARGRWSNHLLSWNLMDFSGWIVLATNAHHRHNKPPTQGQRTISEFGVIEVPSSGPTRPRKQRSEPSLLQLQESYCLLLHQPHWNTFVFVMDPSKDYNGDHAFCMPPPCSCRCGHSTVGRPRHHPDRPRTTSTLHAMHAPQ